MYVDTSVAGRGAGASGAPMTATERAVADVWKSILNLKEVGPHDDFFELGGTSLDLIRVFVGVNDAFGLALDGSVLGEEATIANLARCVDARPRR